MITSARSPLIIAVSGGIDSVTLLHMLAEKSEHLIVAHVNHGIRPDSDDDETFVRQLAESYGLPFLTTRLKLGPRASEDTARKARYSWLEKTASDHDSVTIATAHHQDDVLETIMINLIRGTGWRGLCSLRSTGERLRPMLSMSKADIVGYAIEHDLQWREDSTNDSLHYLRNRIRHQLIPRLAPVQRKKLVDLYETQCTIRNEIESECRLLAKSYINAGAIERYPLIMLESDAAVEVLKIWLGETFEASRMTDLLLFAKVGHPGDKWSIDSTRFVVADKTRLIVLTPSD